MASTLGSLENEIFYNIKVIDATRYTIREYSFRPNIIQLQYPTVLSSVIVDYYIL